MTYEMRISDWSSDVCSSDLSSIVFRLEAQVNYVLKGIRALLDRKLKFIDVKPSRQDAYSTHVQKRLKGGVWDSGCTSWYKTASGKNTANWPGFTFSFRLMTRNIDLDDYELQDRKSTRLNSSH